MVSAACSAWFASLQAPYWKHALSAFAAVLATLYAKAATDGCARADQLTKVDDQLLWQVKGIPMGDPISPGMTIITCARMEQRWTATLAAEKTLFRAARFMDDILLVYAAHAGWDHSELVRKLSAAVIL